MVGPPNAIDAAWAAGLFEGEGCITPTRRRMGLGMTDEDSVRRFHRIVGVGAVYERSCRSGKTLWQWESGAWDDVVWVVEVLYANLGARRRARADELRANVPALILAAEQGYSFAQLAHRAELRGEKELARRAKRYRSRKSNGYVVQTPTRLCDICGAPFFSRVPHRKRCGEDCQAEAHRRKMRAYRAARPSEE